MPTLRACGAVNQAATDNVGRLEVVQLPKSRNDHCTVAGELLKGLKTFAPSLKKKVASISATKPPMSNLKAMRRRLMKHTGVGEDNSCNWCGVARRKSSCSRTRNGGRAAPESRQRRNARCGRMRDGGRAAQGICATKERAMEVAPRLSRDGDGIHAAERGRRSCYTFTKAEYRVAKRATKVALHLSRDGRGCTTLSPKRIA
ncbi:hypothetical protein H6P81_003422 [Aristolochia fimbriata]|uniref:Uncharacterized protein n=1 Tax=Aristolochia fimbriata TaxID=158543 RepID=A0AAV7FEA1_ARIFI|nr:hypothetical protein H6P81_003422 [Aristolochia fimbriata]